MTYCCGFKHLDSVYLFADSAVTSNEAPAGSPEETSFGIKHIRKKNESVTEAIIKITKISERCYVAFAGDVFRALDMIDVLISQHRENQDFQKTIGFVNSSFGADQSQDENVALLIAYNSDSGSHLYRWDSVRRNLESIENYCGIGSLPEKEENKIQDFISFLTREKFLEKDALLTGVAAFYQSLGLKREILAQYVGGAMTGVEVSRSGTNWLGETAYVIFDREGQYQKTTIVVNYGGGFTTLAVSNRKIKYYLTAYKEADYIPWLEKWKPEIDSVLTSLSARNWVFLNPQKNIFFIVQAKAPVSQTAISEIWFEENTEKTFFDSSLLYVLKEAYDHSFEISSDENSKEFIDKCFENLRLEKAVEKYEKENGFRK